MQPSASNGVMMPRNLSSSPLMRPLVVLALPGMYLFYKYSQYKRQQQEQNRRRVTERELAHLNHKIDKLLSKLEENEPELATSQEDECVICVNAKATMQTSPCGHRVVCRKCFVKTIQMAVSQRLLPLRCVICRAKILRLKASGRMVTSASHYSVPNSESLYSMSSGSSSFSGVSSSSAGSSCSSRSQRTYRQPSGSLRKSQTQSMKEYKEPRSSDKTARLPPIQEFQREYRLGKERSSSTRIRCAQKIVTQLETTPVNTAKPTSFFRASSSGPNHKEDRTRSEEKRATPSKSSSQTQASSSSGSSQPDSKKSEKVKQEKKEKAKEKELSKAEKKEQKKEAKAEKKNAKKESKNEKKDKKENNDSKKQ
ncbi:micronuclear linker histone polyprotein isoform X2 [Halyomorpha halys]|uniref:micronuclear linker histone polyprotein isoform X2 n=1 Tax=Halyomorpha halys TaxID=286706 RepID=UPI000D0C7F46|nr:uncharacterized protein LOC106684817 isoform X2 [Halyomorpha halys]